MNVVNLIHIGDKVVNFKDLTPEEKRKVAIQLNRQALASIGYVTKDETAQAVSVGQAQERSEKMQKPIIPIPRASENVINALVEAGILEVTEEGIRCAETKKQTHTSFGRLGSIK